MDKIVEIQMARLDSLLADRKIVVTLDEKARHWLGNAGYDPVYGARPLKRVIQRRLQDPLAQLILEGRIGEGAAVTVSASATGLTLNGQEFAATSDELVDVAPEGIALN
jgi:ATP-dependent Clp protease ATP-binding subunit ClpB